jgi:hypothetical protein
MTTATKEKRTQKTRTSGPHRTRPTRRSVHRREQLATRPTVQAGPITVDRAFLTEARDWTVLAGASLAGYLTFAIAIGAV